jgi:hypothetical protein
MIIWKEADLLAEIKRSREILFTGPVGEDAVAVNGIVGIVGGH